METKQSHVIDAYTALSTAYQSGKRDVRDIWRYMTLSKFKTDYFLIYRIPNNLKNKIVLNIGTSYPLDELFFARSVDNFYTVDITRSIIELSKKIVNQELSETLKKKIIFQIASATDLPFKSNSFNVSMSFSTLEHIPDNEQRLKAFSEIARVTKVKGYVIITVPNKLSLFKMRRSVKLQKQSSLSIGYEHWYTPRQLKKILISNGLKPLLFRSSASGYTGRLSNALHLPINKFGTRMGYLCVKIHN
ncbi:MAG: class I SAM-dependent methyltransferase [Candidatus Hodarchaeota archaeon]